MREVLVKILLAKKPQTSRGDLSKSGGFQVLVLPHDLQKSVSTELSYYKSAH